MWQVLVPTTKNFKNKNKKNLVMARSALSVKKSTKSQWLATRISNSEVANNSSKFSPGTVRLFQPLKAFREEGDQEKNEWRHTICIYGQPDDRGYIDVGLPS